MSKLKISNLRLYSTVLGLLVTLSIGCKDKTHEEFCHEFDDNKAKCNDPQTKHKDGGTCHFVNNKCEPATGKTHLQEEGPTSGKSCAKLSENECLGSKDCTFDTNKRVCNDAATKNLCVNIALEDACKKDTLCTWDIATKICKDKVALPPVAQNKTIKVFTVKRASRNLMPDDQIDNMVVANNEWAYFSSGDNAHFTIFNIESPEKLTTNAKDDSFWTKTQEVAKIDTGLGNAGIATGTLAGNQVIHRMEATKKGVVISMVGSADQVGVGLLEGKTWKAAWVNNTGHRDIEDGIVADIADPLFGMVMKKSTGEEYLTIFGQKGNDFTAMTGGVDLNGTADIKVKLNQLIDRKSTAFRHLPFHAPGFLVDPRGITVVKDDQVNTAQDFPNVDPNDVDLGSDRWTIKGSNARNNEVAAVALVNGKLFIALRKDGQHSGGVAVFDPAAKFGKKITPPKGEWDNISVIGLTVDSNNAAWAVTQTGLMRIDENNKPEMATMLSKATMNKEAYTDDFNKENDKATRFDGELDSGDSITSAAWVGPHLMIATANEGLWFLFHQSKELIKN